MSHMDLFDPQIKLNQETLNQKFMDESVSFRNASLLDSEPSSIISNHFNQSKLKPSNYKPGQKSIKDAQKQTIKSNNLRKFFFNQSKVKQMAQNFIKKSQIIQDKFRNHSLLREEYLNDNSFKLNGINKIQSIFPLINLNNNFLQIWELLKLLIYFYFMWIMPFKGSFLSNQEPFTHELILFYLIVLDKFLQLNKEILVEGQLISDRGLILQQFIQNSLIFELLYMFFYTCITYQFLEQEITQIFNIGFFFLNLKKFQQCIQNYQERSISINDKINLLELIITVLMLAHFMACVWFYVGTISQQYFTESWILKLNLQNESTLTQYCYSFYWAAATMVTVGYGDITGQNLYEIICSTILLFFSSGIFAFSMNSIGMILNNINQNGQQYRRNLLLINQYMDQNNVNGDLQVKVRNYLQFQYQSQLSNHQKDVNTIIEQLSQNLRVELMNDVRLKIIQSNSFLKNNFSNSTRLQIIQQSQSINYTPLEQIYQQKSNDDYSLYVISKGFINLIDQNSGRIIEQLKQGDSFGELEFLTEQPRYLSAYSKGFSQILKVNRNDFIQLIKQNPQDFEQFHMLKDQILFNLSSINKCDVCKENHVLFQCNKIFYRPNIERIIKSELFHTYQERQQFQRNRQRNQFQLQDNQMIKVACQAFRYDNDIVYQSKDNISYKSRETLNNSSSSDSDSKMIQSSNDDKTSIYQLRNVSNKRISYIRMEQEEQKRTSDVLTRRNKRLSHIRSSSREQIRIQNTQKKKSIYYTTLIQKQQSNRDQRLLEDNKFFEIDQDQYMNYYNYFPNSNIKNMIRLFDKLRKKNQNNSYMFIHSNYRFFQFKIQKALDEYDIFK